MLHIDIPTLEEFKALAQIKGETCTDGVKPKRPTSLIFSKQGNFHTTSISGYLWRDRTRPSREYP